MMKSFRRRLRSPFVFVCLGFAVVVACSTPRASGQTVEGSVSSASAWDNLSSPPGDGGGSGTVYVGAWSSEVDVQGVPVANSPITSGALPLSGNLGAFSLAGLPPGNYQLAAWIDGDGNAGYDLGEPVSAASAVTILSNDVAGVMLAIVDDSDEDALPDWWEIHWMGNLDESSEGDPDADGLTNLEELQNGIDPFNWDTDGDGMDDGWEVTFLFGGIGPDPAVSDPDRDSDGDGLSNRQEYLGVDGRPPMVPDPKSKVRGGKANVLDAGDGLVPTHIDSDGDSLIDSFEAAWYDPANGINPSSAGNPAADQDEDGLSAYREQCLLPPLRQGGANDIWTYGWPAYYTALVAPDEILLFTTPILVRAPAATIRADLAALRAGPGNAWTDPSRGSGHPQDFPVDGGDGWDTDRDLLPDGWELEFNLDPTDGTGDNGYYGDPDGDGLVNFEEFNGQDGFRSETLPFVNGTGDETNPNGHNWRPQSTASGPGTERPGIAMGASYWISHAAAPASGTLGAALPTISLGADDGADSDDDGYTDAEEIQNEFEGGYIGTSPVHSMHPFIRRGARMTAAAGMQLTDPEGLNRPTIHRRSWALECYVKVASENCTGHLINVPGPTANRIPWRLSLSNNVPRVEFETLGGYHYYVEGLALPTNMWMHVAGVWNPDQNSLALYINGIFFQEKRVYQESLAGYLFAPALPATIGTSSDGSFVGNVCLDEVRIWGVARTAAQIEEYRTRLVPPGSAGLIAYYRFDDGGATAEDFASKAKNGLLGAKSEDYPFGDSGYALPAVAFEFLDTDSADVFGVSPRGADDRDGDGMPDAWEMINHLDPDVADADEDADGDGLCNLYEFWSETNPRAEDTDSDSEPDGQEDFDGDGAYNIVEQAMGSRPDIVDTDDDGLTDNEERAAGRNPTNAVEPYVAQSLWLADAANDFLTVPIGLKQRLPAWTLEAWVSPSDVAGERGHIIARSVQELGNGTNAYNYVLGLEKSGPTFRPYAGFVRSSGDATYAWGNEITVGDWVHLAAAFDPAARTLAIYENGVKVGELTEVNALPPVNGRGGETFLRIGEGYSGAIDEVRIWNMARPEDSISNQFATVLSGTEPGLVHDFRFDDGEAVSTLVPFGPFHQPRGAQDFTYPADWNEEWRHAAVTHGAVQFASVEYRLDLLATAGGEVAPPSNLYLKDTLVAVAATASNNYHFAKWTGDTDAIVAGGIQASNVTVAVTRPIELTAVFELDQNAILVRSEFGQALPPEGVHLVGYGSDATLSITNSPLVQGATQYVCTGWIGTGDVPAMGTELSTTVTVTQASSITWQWKTQYWMTVSAGIWGSVAPHSQWVDVGATALLTAVPDPLHYSFDRWSGDVPAGREYDNPLSMTMDRPRAVEAAFNAELVDIPDWWMEQYGLTNDVANQHMDHDGDGMLTWQEYYAGTDPIDPLSFFVVHINPVGVGGETHHEISFLSVTGRFYKVEYSDGMPVAWMVLTNNIPGTGALIVVYDDTHAPLRMYRVIVSPTMMPPFPEGPSSIISAGSFLMGAAFGDAESGPSALPVHSVNLASYMMDRREVSKALWDDVYNWGRNHGYQFDNVGTAAASNHPVYFVNWYDAVKWCNARSEMEGLTPAYYQSSAKTSVYRSGQIDLSSGCVRWDVNGYRLPTEAEWERAARGGLVGRAFPWGNSLDGSMANYRKSGDEFEPWTTPVGYYDGSQTPPGTDMANGFGLYDAAGNVGEWCWDWFDPDWYEKPEASLPNTHGPVSGSIRVHRGGSWNSDPTTSPAVIGVSLRYFALPSMGSMERGFRCVRALW